MKSWSNLKINDSFRIYSSWAFWNTPNMSDLSDYSMRYSKFKYNQIFASDFSQRLSSCVLHMPSNENLKASICSLVTPLSSHVIKFIVHSIILIWQAMFSCPAWFWLYCIYWILACFYWVFGQKVLQGPNLQGRKLQGSFQITSFIITFNLSYLFQTKYLYIHFCSFIGSSQNFQKVIG